MKKDEEIEPREEETKDWRSTVISWAEKFDTAVKSNFERINAFVSNNKTIIYQTLVGLGILAVITLGFILMTSKSYSPTIIQDDKSVSYSFVNPGSTVQLEYEWVDTVSLDQWNCSGLETVPRARIIYMLNNVTQKRVLLPVPDHIYPDYFVEQPKFTWMDGLYIVVDRVEVNETERREYLLDMKTYNLLCAWAQEVGSQKANVEQKYQNLVSSNMDEGQKQEVRAAYISYTKVASELDQILTSVRNAGPEVMMAYYDRIVRGDLRTSSFLTSNVIIGNYMGYATIEQLEGVQKSQVDINTRVTDLEQQLDDKMQKMDTISEYIQKQSQKPTLEDLLAAYYNNPQK